jgi:hypothetical protein
MIRNRSGQFTRRTSVPIVRPFKMQVRLLRVARACVAVTCTAILTAYIVAQTSRANIPVKIDQIDVAQVVRDTMRDVLHEQQTNNKQTTSPVVSHASKQTTNKRHARRCACRCH